MCDWVWVDECVCVCVIVCVCVWHFNWFVVLDIQLALAQAELNKSWGSPTADSFSQIATPDGAGINPTNMNMVTILMTARRNHDQLSTHVIHVVLKPKLMRKK